MAFYCPVPVPVPVPGGLVQADKQPGQNKVPDSALFVNFGSRVCSVCVYDFLY